jgi:hypothetical protein
MKKNTSNFPLPTYYGFTGYLELPQTQNRYAYCINNPLKYIDPLGLDGENGVWTKYPEIWFYIYGNGEMPTVTVIPYNWWATLSLIQQMEILGYGNDPGIGRPPGYVPPSPEDVIILNLGNPGFENYRLGENGIEIIKEPSGGAQPGGRGGAQKFTPPKISLPPQGSPAYQQLIQSHRTGYKILTIAGGVVTGGIVAIASMGTAVPFELSLLSASLGITGIVGTFAVKDAFSNQERIGAVVGGVGSVVRSPALSAALYGSGIIIGNTRSTGSPPVAYPYGV